MKKFELNEHLPLEGIYFSYHGWERLQQRGLNVEIVAYALKYGELVYATGIRFFFLANNSIPADHRCLNSVVKAVGTTVLVSPDNTIITVYKNPKALRDIRRKGKKRWCSFNKRPKFLR